MIPAAASYIHWNNQKEKNDIVKAMIQFARMHVAEALKIANRNADEQWNNDAKISDETILNAYPPENIK